jgi:O-antigen ligase
MRTIQVGVCLLIAFAVLAFGAAEPWGEAILEIGAALLLVIWGALSIQRGAVEIRGAWIYIVVLGLLGFGIAQMVFGLSVYPYATKVELLRWGAYFILCFLAVESFRTEQHLNSFAWFLVSLGFIVSLFGIVQYFTSNGKLYWLVAPHRGGGTFGPFVYHNHFAGFVELVDPFGLGLIFSGQVRRDQLPVLTLFTIVPIAALVLSASRGGITSFFLQLVLLGFLLGFRNKHGKNLLKIASLVVVAAALIFWVGIASTVQRFEDLSASDGSAVTRASMSKDTWQIFLHHPLAGTGIGTFETVYPQYASSYDGLRLDHAHNDYVELLASTGLVGGVFGFAFVVFLFRSGYANVRSAQTPGGRAFYASAVAACSGILFHSFVDFNLHLPSNAMIFLILAGLATSCALPRSLVLPIRRGLKGCHAD